MKKIYLAGPMRGIPEFNFPAFYAAEAELRKLGYSVHNPAREDDEMGFQWRGAAGDEDISELWGSGTPRSLNDVLSDDLTWILNHADAVAVLPGWQDSKGARAEVACANAVGVPVGSYKAFGLKDLPMLRLVPPVSLLDEGAADEEVRVTSGTGGQKGEKLAQLGSIDAQALLTVAKVSGFGARKYARYNYMKGYDWSLSFDALQRHLLSFWAGEDDDPESGLSHLGHAAWHCLALLSFQDRQLGRDDRYRQPTSNIFAQ